MCVAVCVPVCRPSVCARASVGTGLTATPEVAQETHAYIRSWFVENYSDAIADDVIIQYGGSVNAENVDELMACPDIDGALSSAARA